VSEQPADVLHDALMQVYEDAGKPMVPRLAELARADGIKSPNTFYELVGRKRIPTEATVDGFVAACIAYAREQGRQNVTARYATDEWRNWIHKVRDDAVTRREAAGAPPAARSIDTWSPARLHVHRAVNQARRADPRLPRYVRRPHDDQLDALLSEVSESLLVVLVADSSTGKTRALYEAVSHHPILATWPLAYPRSAAALLSGIDDLAAGTVLWLNDLENHLAEPDADAVAAALQDLLSDPDRGPVIALATLWRRHWSVTLDAFAPAVRDLLRHHSQLVHVPEAFAVDELRALLADPDLDRDLEASARSAHGDGRVIQTATGGPLLVEEYLHPVRPGDYYRNAVLTAALDAWRLGHVSPLAPALFNDAAHAYLTGRHRIGPPKDWIKQGLAAARTECLGVSALTEDRVAPGVGPPDGFALHDYLAQHGGTARRGDRVPAALWEGLIAHSTTPEDLVRVGASAESRMLFDVAERCYRRAGTPRALDALASLYDDTDRTAKAVALMRAQAATDDPAALRWLRNHQRSTGNDESALATARRLVEIGGTEADRDALARLLENTGRPDDALTHWRILIAGGDRRALDHVVAILINSERFDDALAALAGAQASADHRVSSLTDRVLRSADRVTELEHRYREREDTHDLVRLLADRGDVRGLLRLADNGDAGARHKVVHELVERGEREQAEKHVRRWATTDDPNAPWSMPQLYEQVGLPDEALHLWLAADRQEPGNDDLQAVTADHLFSAGRVDELRERAGNPADSRARDALARWLAANGGIDELRDRARSGDVTAAGALADRLVADRQPAEAIAVWEDVASTDNRYALKRLASLHAAHGDPTRAREIAAAVAIGGGKQARQFYVDILSTTADESTLRSLLGKPGYEESAADTLGKKLAERGDYRGLCELVLLNVAYSRWHLTNLAKDHPSGDEWTTLWRRGLTPDGHLAPPPDQSQVPELDDQP
jgi:tetratricopeptide (TPR) repeat protein